MPIPSQPKKQPKNPVTTEGVIEPQYKTYIACAENHSATRYPINGVFVDSLDKDTVLCIATNSYILSVAIENGYSTPQVIPSEGFARKNGETIVLVEKEGQWERTKRSKKGHVEVSQFSTLEGKLPNYRAILEGVLQSKSVQVLIDSNKLQNLAKSLANDDATAQKVALLIPYEEKDGLSSCNQAIGVLPLRDGTLDPRCVGVLMPENLKDIDAFKSFADFLERIKKKTL